MEQIKLEVQLRNETGSVDVKNLRKAGYIPGVVYGGAEKPVSVKLLRKDFDRILRQHAGEGSLYQVTVTLVPVRWGESKRRAELALMGPVPQCHS